MYYARRVSGTLKTKIFESQIIWKSLGTSSILYQYVIFTWMYFFSLFFFIRFLLLRYSKLLIMSEWVIVVNAKWKFFSCITEDKFNWMRWWWLCPLCSRPTRLFTFFIVLCQWNNNPREDMSPYSTYYPDSHPVGLCSYS